MLVGVEQQGFPFFLGYRYRDDLVAESPGLKGFLVMVLGLEGENILFLTAHFVPLGHVLRRLTHGIWMVHFGKTRVGKTPTYGRVMDLRNPPEGLLGFGHHKRRPAHAL